MTLKKLFWVNKRTLLLIAGIVWLIAGFNVARLGIVSYGMITFHWYYIPMSIAVFAAFGTMFFRMTQKHTKRIKGYEGRQPFWHFFDLKAYIIMAIMMGGGIGLRVAGVIPDVFVAFFYSGLGCALALAGVVFIIRFIRFNDKTQMDFEAVVFDMDGVIFDSERATMECWLALADKYKIENIKEPYLACTGTTMARTREIMLEAYGEDFPYDDYAKEASKMYHEKYDGGRLPMKTGVQELLQYLKENHIKIALASSTRKQTVENQLRDAHIIDYFDAIVCGDMVKKSKPDPEIFLLACEKLGVKPQKAFAIEDSYNGIRAAFAGKLRPIMVPDLLPPNDEMKELAEAIPADLLEVITILDAKKADKG